MADKTLNITNIRTMPNQSTSPGKGKTEETRKLCSLCGQPFIGFGNNPEPLKRYEDRCCDKCNFDKVIPARLRVYRREA